MSIQEAVLKNLDLLSPEQQKEVLDFILAKVAKSESVRETSAVKTYTLSELMAEVTPENIHRETDTGNAVGYEVG